MFVQQLTVYETTMVADYRSLLSAVKCASSHYRARLPTFQQLSQQYIPIFIISTATNRNQCIWDDAITEYVSDKVVRSTLNLIKDKRPVSNYPSLIFHPTNDRLTHSTDLLHRHYITNHDKYWIRSHSFILLLFNILLCVRWACSNNSHCWHK